MSIITDFVATLEADAKAVEDKIVQFAGQFLPPVVNDAEIALCEVAQIALNAVLKAAPLAISGSEKFSTAFTDVVQAVEAQGKTIAINTANMVVQQAYLTAQSVAKSAATPPTPPAA